MLWLEKKTEPPEKQMVTLKSVESAFMSGFYGPGLHSLQFRFVLCVYNGTRKPLETIALNRNTSLCVFAEMRKVFSIYFNFFSRLIG